MLGAILAAALSFSAPGGPPCAAVSVGPRFFYGSLTLLGAGTPPSAGGGGGSSGQLDFSAASQSGLLVIF